MLNIRDLRDCVVAPTLQYLGMHSLAAEQLLLGTAVHESGLRYLQQIGGGPARGLWQMEPETYFDIWANWLRHRQPIADKVKSLRASWPEDTSDQLFGNLPYACAMARIHYWRRSEPLPPAGDAQAIGRYWKKHYNTVEGAGTVLQFCTHYEQYVSPIYS